MAQLGRKPEYTKLVCLTWWARAFVFPCSETNEKVPYNMAVAVGAVGAVGAAVAVGMLWVARG